MKRDKGPAATKLAFASLVCLNFILIVIQFTKPSTAGTIPGNQLPVRSSVVTVYNSTAPLAPVEQGETIGQVDNPVIEQAQRIMRDIEEEQPQRQMMMSEQQDERQVAMPEMQQLHREPKCPKINITVTYNVFIWPEQDWQFLVGSQLDDLESTGLYDCANTVISLSVPEQHENFTFVQLQQLMSEAVFFIREQIVGKYATIVQEHDNAFEYPGINSVYRWANSESDELARNHLYLYFHTKGMVNHGLLLERVDTDIFDATILPWRAVAEQFIQHDDIRAAAWMPSERGWGWHNFWWARGSWLKKLKVPFRHPDRFFFESWLGDVEEDVRAGTKVLSLCTCDFSFVEPEKIPIVQQKCKPVTAFTCWPRQRSLRRSQMTFQQNAQEPYAVEGLGSG